MTLRRRRRRATGRGAVRSTRARPATARRGPRPRRRRRCRVRPRAARAAGRSPELVERRDGEPGVGDHRGEVGQRDPQRLAVAARDRRARRPCGRSPTPGPSRAGTRGRARRAADPAAGTRAGRTRRGGARARTRWIFTPVAAVSRSPVFATSFFARRKRNGRPLPQPPLPTSTWWSASSLQRRRPRGASGVAVDDRGDVHPGRAAAGSSGSPAGRAVSRTPTKTWSARSSARAATPTPERGDALRTDGQPDVDEHERGRDRR